MKALIYDIKRFAVHDGPGIRTTIFFKGCPLGCWWCHNPESRRTEIEHTKKINQLDGISYPDEVQTGEYWSIESLMNEIRKEKVFMDESGGGVTLSGGEPLLQHEFVLELITVLKSENIHIAIDTTGFASKDIFSKIGAMADMFLYDLKHMDDNIHMNYTGVGNKQILQNLEYLHERKISVIIRYPLIPGINDGDNLLQMRDYLLNKCPEYKELHILPFHNIADHKYLQFGIENKMKNYSEPSMAQVDEVREFFENAGFLVKIGG